MLLFLLFINSANSHTAVRTPAKKDTETLHCTLQVRQLKTKAKYSLKKKRKKRKKMGRGDQTEGSAKEGTLR